MIPTVEWKEGVVHVLDQSLLPGQVKILECADYLAVADAIRALRVRGAPAIGVTAAMGVALGAQTVHGTSCQELMAVVQTVCHHLAATRPTAVNLFWAIERMKRVAAHSQEASVEDIKAHLVNEALAIQQEDLAMCRTMGRLGAQLIQDGQTILTHCNAGALATAGYGTALGVVRAAWESGKHIQVMADETRPVLQGARLTTWELMQDGIPVTLITDNMAGSMMRQGKIQVCVVGADRIAANGDVANKIGTYAVAVLAKVHGIPFYVAAPSSTIDLTTATGEAIPIEERAREEVLFVQGGACIAPADVQVLTPAFDITPAEYVSRIITERGVWRPQEIAREACERIETRSTRFG